MVFSVARRGLPNPNFLSASNQKGLTSLLTQTYNKPVTLNLIKLNRPQDDADLLAQRLVQQLRDRKASPRRATRDASWKAELPSRAAITAQKQELLQRKATIKPLTLQALKFGGTSATPVMGIADILKDLELPQVTSVAVKASGRLSPRITASRTKPGKVARAGLSTKGETHLLRGFYKGNSTSGMRAGKKRIGAYGIRVGLGHS